MSEGTRVNKTTDSRERTICHYWYILKISFNFQPKMWDGCHDLMQKAVSFDDIAIGSLKGNDCRIHFGI